MEKDILLDFLSLKHNKNSLIKFYGKNPIYVKPKLSVTIKNEDVIRLIEFYVAGKIHFTDVIDWCDIVRFSDLFDYPDDLKSQEAIATVIDEIQDTEDTNKTISDVQIKRWLNILN